MKIYTIINFSCTRIILVIFLLQILLLFHVGKTSFAEDREQVSWRRGFDEQDRLSKLIDPSGRETRFKYSTTPQKTQRVTKIQPEGNWVIWDYDKLGRLSTMADGAGNVDYGYDDLGRLNYIQREKTPALTYDYDMLDRIVSLRVGNLYELTYSYDFLGRLESIDTPAGNITYKYLTGQGLLVRTLPNGIQTRWEIEANGQLRKITHGINVGGNKIQTLAEYTYEYRTDGLISSIEEYSTQEEFKSYYIYDKVGRLIEVTDTREQQCLFVYDQVGNRLGGTHPSLFCYYDWAGRLLSLNGKSCIHDAAGNLASVTIGDSVMNYLYNPDGQLKDANGNVAYRYDGNGRLISRKVGEIETNIIPDPFSNIWQPLVIENENGSGGKTLVVWERKTPLIMIRNGKPEYMLHDHLGSVRLIANEQGKVVRKVGYSPFGVVQEPEISSDFAPRYAGLFWDAKAQTYLTLARAYSPGIGRFLGPDPKKRLPFGSQKDFANYVYCGDDPVNFVDLNGREPQQITSESIIETGQRVRNVLIRISDPNTYNWKERALTSATRGDMAGVYFFSGFEAIGSTVADLYNRKPVSSLGNPLYKKNPLFNNQPKWSKSVIGDALKVSGNKYAKGIGEVLGYADKVDSNDSVSSLFMDFGVDIAKGAIVKSWAGPAGAPLGVLEWSINKMSGIEEFNRELDRVTTYMPVNYNLFNEEKNLEERLSSGDPRVIRTSGGGIAEIKLPNFPSIVGGDGLSTVQPSQKTTNILISGRGINQYDDINKIEVGHFTYDNHVVYKLPSKHIDEIEYHKTTDQVADEVYTLLKRHLAPQGTLKPGQSFELRTAHDVNTMDYLHGGEPQERARKHTVAVLKGVDKFKAEFGLAQNQPITVGVQAGSNDGMAYTHAINEMAKNKHKPVDFIFYDDPQAKISEVEKLIPLLGERNVAIFLPKSGFGDKIRGKGEIASYRPNAENLSNKHPGVRVFRYEAKDGILPGFKGHIQASIFPRETDNIQLYNSNNSRWEAPRKTTFGSFFDNQFAQIYKERLISENNTQKSSVASTVSTYKPLTLNEYKPWKYQRRKRDDVYGDVDVFFGGGPGGPGGPEGGSPLRSMSPSTVGGVYLGGAGKVLDDIGLFEGVMFDSDNNLILLSKSGDKINLPPLRLDDVVTVFRSVYIYGEGPTVTIDPKPDNPEGPTMIIRHGKATEDTYVGWILYHADRLMKCYTLGVNNKKTDEDFVSTVPGYEEVLDALYFGDDTPEKLRKGGYWERFWIVPSYSCRFNNVHSDLTLFDVPLKVKTQVMKWKEGKLVDDSNGMSSVGAMEFIEWFTRQYDLISREQYLTPPPESGITKPVPVFSELRRVALITAIAEKLQDQGIPMPFWMRNYEVSPVTFEKTTPALLKERSNNKFTAQVYGGANMSPESKDVKQFTQKSDLSNLPDTERTVVEKLLKRANSISEVIQESMPSTKPFRSRHISFDGDTYNALSIPGSEVRALAPCQLEEIDMIVPIEEGYEISLSRNYNSFFDPSGLWGRGWTLNLPWLEEVKVPIIRIGSQVTYRMDYELLTPLNNFYMRFSGVEKVPSLNNSQLQTPDKDCGFFGLADGSPTFLSFPTLKLLCKDGEIWHFTKAGDHFDKTGDLVAIEKDGFRTVYKRNKNGRVLQIEGWLGSHKMATIELSYDDMGRLESAIGKNNNGEGKIRYEYNADGKLADVVSEHGKLGYRYMDSWVTLITWQNLAASNDEKPNKEKILRRFEYNGKGQLFAEINGDGQRIIYNVTTGPLGNAVTVTMSGEKNAMSEAIQYDATYRPVEARYSNGTQANWTYSDNGEYVLSLKSPDGGEKNITVSADRRRQTFNAPDMPELVKEYDKAGRLTAITENGQNLICQHWYPDGKLQAIENDSCAATPQYNQDGLMTSVNLSPPEEKESLKPKYWQKTELDIAGRPVKISDYQGLDILARYDNNGNIDKVVTMRDKEKYGFNITRDDVGRIHTIDSSWDNQQFKYNEDGTLAMITLSKKPYENKIQQSVLEFESDLLIRAKQFDGGKVKISYYSEEPHANLPKQITCANGLNLNYYYSPLNKLEKVKVGNQSLIALDYDTKGRIVGYSCRSAEN